MPRRDWNPRRALAVCPEAPLKGAVWRGHRRRYSAIGHQGSLVLSGRYHQATDLFPTDRTWPALYTAMGLHVALGEIYRGVTREKIGEYRFTEIWVQLDAVLDCRDLTVLGLAETDLLDDVDVETPRALAAAALDRGVEGILVPSATRLGDNLIIFPELVRGGSVIVEVQSIDPALVKLRPDDFQ
jgi:RES domain-containing protein